MARIGIIGGTFDPIHKGHTECAEKIKKEFNLDSVILLPAGNPPHKFARPVTPSSFRLRMTEIAARSLEGITVSDVEVKKTGYSFSADTLSEIKGAHPSDEFYYVIGTDAAEALAGWKDADRLKDYCSFILVKRGNADASAKERAIKAIEAIGANVLVSDEKVRTVSSTEIRNCFLAGNMPGPELLDPEVAKYIVENGIYSSGGMKEEFIIEDLRSVLPQKRFIHSLGVAEEAVRLAVKFGADPAKARLAGLLHDCAKGVSIPQLRWINMTEKDFSPEPAAGFSYRVLHGPLGAIVAEKRYGVTDPEILSAIAKHTTGDKEMSLLDRIVFIADCTEKNRCGEFFAEVRRLTDTEGLLAAMGFACDETIKVILKRGEPIDIRTVYTRNMALNEKAKS